MKANELRIGNWIHGRIGYNIQVDSGVLLGLEAETLGYDPIPLTEEWFFKFGFEYDYVFYTKGILNLCPNRNSNYTPYIHTLTHGRVEIDITYVHQLQNLYFALTGEELVRR